MWNHRVWMPALLEGVREHQCLHRSVACAAPVRAGEPGKPDRSQPRVAPSPASSIGLSRSHPRAPQRRRRSTTLRKNSLQRCGCTTTACASRDRSIHPTMHARAATLGLLLLAAWLDEWAVCEFGRESGLVSHAREATSPDSSNGSLKACNPAKSAKNRTLCTGPLTNNSVFIYHIHIHVKPHLSRARQAAAGA